MNFSFILDIAIGLIFIYLILSLLSSEIQELLTTLLQWRAVHLKKSVEILLTGGESTPEDESVKNIVNDLYNNPLIKNINQEAKGGIALFFRQITWLIGGISRKITRAKHDLGKDENGKDRTSAPSYIPAETFATTLMEKLRTPEINHELNSLNLKKLEDNEIEAKIIILIDETTDISDETRQRLNDRFQELSSSFDDIFNLFDSGKISIRNALIMLQKGLHKFIENSSSQFNPENETLAQEKFVNKLQELEDNVFIDIDEVGQRLKPRISQIINMLNTSHEVYEDIKKDLGDENTAAYKIYQGIEQKIHLISSKLPKQVQDSLSALASRAQMKAAKTEDELQQFQKEIETWFDSSMERASGVYKRNAKGVAFVIGFLIAFVANADTFHIVNRLSKDSALRNAIVENAGKTVVNCPPSASPEQQNSQLDCIRQDVNHSLAGVSLPLGRSEENIKQQEEESAHWQIYGFSFGWLRRFFGWIVSGIAMSMGAPFWFDLLGKIINVRNSGKKPEPSTSNPNA